MYLLQSHYFRNKRLTERSHAQMFHICNCITCSQQQVNAAHSGMQLLLLLLLLLLIILNYFLTGQRSDCHCNFFYPCSSSDKKMVAYQILTQFDIGNLLSESVILILLMCYFFWQSWKTNHQLKQQSLQTEH